MIRDAGDPGDITHVFKCAALYDLPFGQGRRFGGNVNGFVNRLIGDWSVSLVGRIQSGRLVDLGNVRLVGMTADDVQGFFKIRFDDAGKKIWMLPQDVIDNTIRAFNVSATHPQRLRSGGACRPAATSRRPTVRIASRSTTAPTTATAARARSSSPVRCSRTTTSASRSGSRSSGGRIVEFRFEMLNAFNNANFIPVGRPSGRSSTTTR